MLVFTHWKFPIFEKRGSTTKNKFENLDVLDGVIAELFKNLTRISSGFG